MKNTLLSIYIKNMCICYSVNIYKRTVTNTLNETFFNSVSVTTFFHFQIPLASIFLPRDCDPILVALSGNILKCNSIIVNPVVKKCNPIQQHIPIRSLIGSTPPSPTPGLFARFLLLARLSCNVFTSGFPGRLASDNRKLSENSCIFNSLKVKQVGKFQYIFL